MLRNRQLCLEVGWWLTVISNCDTMYGTTVYWYVGIGLYIAIHDAVERWPSDKLKNYETNLKGATLCYTDIIMSSMASPE